MQRYFVLVAGLIGANMAIATPTTFVAKQSTVGGAAIVEYSEAGEYVYASPKKDARPSTKPVLMGPVPRQTYRYFSRAEEQALLAFKNKKLAEQVKAQVIVSRKKHVAKTNHYDWPKVVLVGDQICVPELASADATDWKEHLTCITDREE